MIPVIAIVGRANSGKTTLVEKLVAEFRRRGLCPATLKHAPHGYRLDPSGTDSRRHQAAGALAAGVLSSESLNLTADVPPHFGLADYRRMLAPLHPDLLIVEGFKSESGLARLEVAHTMPAEGLLCQARPQDFVALVSDTVPAPHGLPRVPLSDIHAVADLIAGHLGLRTIS
ncbi:MAG: molybdopterin-guanine dinucleotide biosynthesis protein B [Acidobacteria bacterium]|nr:molybdopterin-guanine dinucleotide biosynthesis protein B [Acidobacteriota bacterium]